jgi:hypothetical protein
MANTCVKFHTMHKIRPSVVAQEPVGNSSCEMAVQAEPPRTVGADAGGEVEITGLLVVGVGVEGLVGRALSSSSHRNKGGLTTSHGLQLWPVSHNAQDPSFVAQESVGNSS